MTLTYALWKVLRAVLTMWLVVTFVFFVLRLTGDPVAKLLPDDVDQNTIDYYRRLWGPRPANPGPVLALFRGAVPWGHGHFLPR